MESNGDFEQEESRFAQQLRAAASKTLCPADADEFVDVLNAADVCVREDLDYYTTHHVMMAFVKSDFGQRSDIDPMHLTRIVEDVKTTTDDVAEQVSITVDGAAGGTAQGRSTQGQSTTMGVKALGSPAQPRTLQRFDMGGIDMPEQKVGTTNAQQWQSSLEKAVAEVEKDFGISVDTYYDGMCSVGKRLLKEKIQQKARGIYNYRAGKQVYRHNRKHKTP